MKVHCLFEQSGTFKNAFKKYGIDMKKDYMGNDQLLPGYNIQFGVCDEYIAVYDFSLFKLRQFPKRSCQYLHAMPSPLFARYTRSSLHPDLFPESSAPLHRLPPKPASSAPAPPDQNVPAHSPQGRSLPVFPRRRP